MAEPIDDGRPFEIGDLWRSSAFVDDNEKADSLFDIQDKQQSFLDLTGGDETAHFVFGNDELGLPTLSSPELPDLEPLVIELNPIVNPIPAVTEQENHEDHYVWDDDLAPVASPRLCTWEAFSTEKRPVSLNVASLSEAGPLTFDAAVHAFSKNRGNDGLMPQDVALRALCNLCLGRSSLFFKWNPLSERFAPILDHVSISGLTQLCSESAVTDFVDFGSLIVKLRHFAETGFEQNVCPSILAFRSGVASILSASSETVSAKIANVHSILQIQHTISKPRRLLQAIWSSVEAVKDSKTDITVISAFADHVYMVTQSDDTFTSVWRTLLARVSMPWLEDLVCELELGNRGYVKPSDDNDTEILDSAPELVSPRMRKKKAKERPSFLRSEDLELIDHTKASLKLIRESIPNHPLVTRTVWGIKAPTECLYGPSFDQSTIIKRARMYERDAIKAMRGIRPSVEPSGSGEDPSIQIQHDIYSQIAIDEQAQEQYVDRLVTQMSSLPEEASEYPADELHDATSTSLSRHESSLQDGTGWMTTTYFNVLDPAVPLIKAQYRLANGALVRHILRKCDLRRHLALQHSFHLLQNGDFVDRLSTALFSTEAESAVRKKGTRITGRTMGLRLGSDSEQHWPPASSELQLTLMGILNEANDSRNAGSTSIASKEQLPGELSFAIRELSEDEIERVLDPNSIYALDFLRLQYTALAPLNAVISPEIMQKYDDIFRFLLVMLRLIHVVTNLRIEASLTRSTPSDQTRFAEAVSPSQAMFAIEAHHFIFTLMRFVMDIGINASWRQFTRSLDELQRALEHEDEAGEVMTRTTMGVDGLKRLHDECLERIRGSLFLRQKNVRIRATVNDVMSSILRCASKLPSGGGDRTSFDAEYAVFSRTMAAFYVSLQEQIDRPLSSSHAGSNGSAETDAYRMLLLQLRWRDLQ